MLVYQIDKKCNPSYKFTDSNRHDGHFAYIGVMHVNKICLVSVILDLEDLCWQRILFIPKAVFFLSQLVQG